MTYALGRRVEYYDMPTVRAIVRDAAQNDYRFSSFISGIVRRARVPDERVTRSSDVETAGDQEPIDRRSRNPDHAITR